MFNVMLKLAKEDEWHGFPCKAFVLCPGDDNSESNVRKLICVIEIKTLTNNGYQLLSVNTEERTFWIDCLYVDKELLLGKGVL